MPRELRRPRHPGRQRHCATRAAAARVSACARHCCTSRCCTCVSLHHADPCSLILYPAPPARRTMPRCFSRSWSSRARRWTPSSATCGWVAKFLVPLLLLCGWVQRKAFSSCLGLSCVCASPRARACVPLSPGTSHLACQLPSRHGACLLPSVVCGAPAPFPHCGIIWHACARVLLPPRCWRTSWRRRR